MKRYDTYKDSGVQWLGEIPGHWGVFQFRKFFKIKKEIAGREGIDVLAITQQGIKIKDITRNEGQIAANYSGYQIVNPSEFAMNHMDLLTGYIDISKFYGVTSPDYRVFANVSKEANSKYYLYVFQLCYKLRIFFGLGQGVANKGRWRLPAKQLNTFNLPLPPLSEQHSIVSYLDDKCGKIDEWVNKKQKEVEHLQELKQRVIADAVTRGLNPHVKMKATNIPWLKEIPEHWEVLRNKSILRLTDEKVGNRNDLTLLSLTKQGVIIRDLSEGKGKFPKDFETYLVVRPNNLVFCLFDIDETPRTVGLVRNYGMLTGAYTNFEVNEDIVLPEYVYCYYLQIDDVKGLRPYYTGLRKVVKTNTFLQLRMPVPPLSEQRSIISYLDAKCSKIDKLIANITKEIECIKEYKQRLISDVVTGQIKVC